MYTSEYVHVFMRVLFLVISGLGIYLICATKVEKKKAGLAVVPQLGFKRPRWNRTDLQEIKIENCNGACHVWVQGAGLYKGKPSERRLIIFR